MFNIFGRLKYSYLLCVDSLDVRIEGKCQIHVMPKNRLLSQSLNLAWIPIRLENQNSSCYDLRSRSGGALLSTLGSLHS